VIFDCCPLVGRQTKVLRRIGAKALGLFVVVLVLTSVVVARETPDVIRGAGARIVDGAIDVNLPPMVHFLNNSDGRFRLLTTLSLRDRTPNQTWKGRLWCRIWREEGGFGSEQWNSIWGDGLAVGGRRPRRLNDDASALLESPVIEQISPIVRYKVLLRGAAHGQKSRRKIVVSTMTVVRSVVQGAAEAAPTLLIARQTGLVYRYTRELFVQLRRRHVSRGRVRRIVGRLQMALMQLDSFAFVLPESDPLWKTVAWSLSFIRRATEGMGQGRVGRQDIMAPYTCTTNRNVQRALRALHGEIEHDRFIRAANGAIAALEAYGWGEGVGGPQLRHELKLAERELETAPDSYVVQLTRCKGAFQREVGHSGSTNSESPERSIKQLFACTERFFNAPCHAARLSVSVSRVLRGLSKL